MKTTVFKIVQRAKKELESKGIVDASMTAYLLSAYNMVESEVAMEFIPLEFKEDIPVREGKILYSDFTWAPFDILSVSVDGKMCKVRRTPESLQISKKLDTAATVRYTYTPARKNLGDVCSYDKPAIIDALVYGICSEYLLAKGNYSLAGDYEKLYRNLIKGVEL